MVEKIVFADDIILSNQILMIHSIYLLICKEDDLNLILDDSAGFMAQIDWWEGEQHKFVCFIIFAWFSMILKKDN